MCCSLMNTQDLVGFIFVPVNLMCLFAQFKLKVETLLSHKICVVQCDGGTKYKPLLNQFPKLSFTSVALTLLNKMD
jgi:hypothetical protein